MLWLALLAPTLVLAFVLAAWPYETWRRAGRLGVRDDGTVSRHRDDVERSQRRRVVVRAAVLPVAIAALAGGAAYAVHEWAPWNAAAAVFGTADPETDLVARSLIERVEERARAQAEETANALPRSLRAPGPVGIRDWLFEHFPAHPAMAALLGLLGWTLCRWVVSERRRYVGGVSRRMRAYQRRDLRRLSSPGPSRHPARP